MVEPTNRSHSVHDEPKLVNSPDSAGEGRDEGRACAVCISLKTQTTTIDQGL